MAVTINTHQTICDCGELIIKHEGNYQYWDDNIGLVTAYKTDGICKECCIFESKLKSEYSPEDEKIAANAKCTICNSTWVDVKNGEDTCRECLRKYSYISAQSMED